MEYNAELYANIVAAIAIAFYFGGFFVRAWRGETGLQKLSAMLVERLEKNTEESVDLVVIPAPTSLSDVEFPLSWADKLRISEKVKDFDIRYQLFRPLGKSPVFEVFYRIHDLDGIAFSWRILVFPEDGKGDPHLFGGEFPTSAEAIWHCKNVFKLMQSWLRK